MMKRLFLIFCFFSFSVFAEPDYSGQLSDIESILFGISGQVDGFQMSSDNYLQQFSTLLTDIHNSQPDYSYFDSYRTYLQNLSHGFDAFKNDYSNFLTEFYDLRYGCLELIETDVNHIKDFIDDIRTSYLPILRDNSNSIVSSLGETIGHDVTEIMNDVDSIQSSVVPYFSFYSDTSKLYDDTQWKNYRDEFLEYSFILSSGIYRYLDTSGNVRNEPVGTVNLLGYSSFFRTFAMRVIQGLLHVSGNTAFIGSFLSPLSSKTSFLAYSDFSHSYATIDFPSNSVPSQVDLTYSGMDFFNASIKLLSDGNKINGATTMFLKHIRERLPDLATKDTKPDEERIEQSIQDSSDRLDSLRQSFEFTEITFKDSAEYFDSDSFLPSLKDSYCPHAIVIRIPGFMGFDEQVVSVLTSDIQPFLDVSRAVFGTVYFVILAGFVWFVFRLFVPVLSRFSKVLATVLNW